MPIPGVCMSVLSASSAPSSVAPSVLVVVVFRPEPDWDVVDWTLLFLRGGGGIAFAAESWTFRGAAIVDRRLDSGSVEDFSMKCLVL